MPTTLFLIRHGATPANLLKPAKLQGRRTDPELAPVGLRQAEMTRDYLALQPFDVIYCSPLKRAMQTAHVIAEPHELTPIIIPEITECDVGLWEGKSWEEIAETDPENYQLYHNDPGSHGYLGGENFTQVKERSTDAFNVLLEKHVGQCVLVVSHHVVNRTYLAGVMGIPPGRARTISLDNCSISIVKSDKGKTAVSTINAVFHLRGIPS